MLWPAVGNAARGHVQGGPAKATFLICAVPYSCVCDFESIGLQSAMLPEAVRVVNLLVTKGHRVYVHCTAGINRATLVVLAYLYFIQGLRRDEALKMVKQGRPVANPYLDCLTEAKRRLLGTLPVSCTTPCLSTSPSWALFRGLGFGVEGVGLRFEA